MKPARYNVTVAESPRIIQVEYRSTVIGIGCTTSGGTYSIEFTRSPLNESGVTPTWFAVSAGLTAATTAQEGTATAVTGIRVTTATQAVDVDITATLDY